MVTVRAGKAAGAGGESTLSLTVKVVTSLAPIAIPNLSLSLCPVLCTLCPVPCTLYPVPCTLCLVPCTLYPYALYSCALCPYTLYLCTLISCTPVTLYPCTPGTPWYPWYPWYPMYPCTMAAISTVEMPAYFGHTYLSTSLKTCRCTWLCTCLRVVYMAYVLQYPLYPYRCTDCTAAAPTASTAPLLQHCCATAASTALLHRYCTAAAPLGS